MAICKICSLDVGGDRVECDGICGHIFHAACLKRSVKVSSGYITCSECSDIRPCHVLRLIRSMTESLASDQSVIGDKVNSVLASFAGLQLLSDDLSSFSGKLDRLLDAATSFNANSSSLLLKLHDTSCRIVDISATVDDIRAVLAGGEANSASACSGPCAVSPAVEDIRRSLKQIRNDFGSLSAAASKNSDDISSFVLDMRGLLSGRCVVDSARDKSCGSSALGSSGRRSARKRKQRRAKASKSAKPRPLPTVEAVPAHLGAALDTAAARQATGIDLDVRRAADDEVSGSSSSTSVQQTPDVRAAIDSVEHNPPTDAGAAFDGVTLRPAVLPRSVFISRVHPDTTADDIIHHISSHFGVTRDGLNCRRIDKSRNGAGSFFASFKVIIPDALFNAVVSPEIWPNGAVVREFIPKNHPGSRVPSKNSLVRSQSITPT